MWTFWIATSAATAAMLAHAPGARVRGHMNRLPFTDHSFGLLVSVSALETSSDYTQAIDEMLRVLKPKCILLLSVLSTEDLGGIERYLKAHTAVSQCQRHHNGPDMLFVVERAG